MELKCPGEPYHSGYVFKCKFHVLAYEIECAERAKEAEKVIDPGLGVRVIPTCQNPHLVFWPGLGLRTLTCTKNTIKHPPS